MRTIEELKNLYYGNINIISDRTRVANELKVSDDYLYATERLITANKDIKKELAEHYSVIRTGRRGTIESFENYEQRMLLTKNYDEFGNVVRLPKYKLGVHVIDDEWLNGEGVTKGCLISLGASSGVGKTELSIMIMLSFATQGRNVLFTSLEMGDMQLFESLYEEGKFDVLTKNPEYKKNFFISFDSTDIDDLAETILIANRDNGIDVFVIDSYLPIETGHSNSNGKMEAVSKMLDEMKRTLNVTIIIIAQWSREDSKTGYYDFSGGNSLKYFSDFVLFIEIFENNLGKNTMRKITCAKNRVFQKSVLSSIITDYDRDSKRIIKIGNSDDVNVQNIAIKRDAKGDIIRKLNF